MSFVSHRRFESRAFAARAFATKRFGPPSDGRWTRDATSGKAVPTEADWTANGYTAKNLYTFQEASGAIVDQIAAADLLAAGAACQYAQTITGWSRKGVKLTESVGQRLAAASGGPDVEGDMTVVAYTTFAASGDRHLFGFGGAYYQVLTNAADHLEWSVDGIMSGGGSSYAAAGLVPIIVSNGRTWLTTFIATPTQFLSPLYSANGTGTDIVVGANAAGINSSSNGIMSYLATLEGLAVERPEAHSLLTQWGWPPTWTPT